MSILTLATAKDYLRTETYGSDDTIQTAIDAAGGLINEFTGRQWALAGNASAQSYVPGPGRVLPIRDCTTVTSIVEYGTTLTVGTDYQLEPLNGLTSSGQATSYTRVLRLFRPWYALQGVATVVVTATWGWATIPSQITEAALILTKDILGHQDVRFGLAGVSDYGGIRARMPEMVGSLIAPFRRAEVLGL